MKPETILLTSFSASARVARAGTAASSAFFTSSGRTTDFASLMGVDLAVGELSGSYSAVWLAFLGEAVVF
jgi:hypothetical protein